MIGVKTLIALTTVFGVVAAAITPSKPVANNPLPNYMDICAQMPRDSTILRPGSCTNWIKCPANDDQSDFEEGSCLFGLYYNKNNATCEPAEQVSCAYDDKTSEKETNRCAKQKDDVFFKDLESCNGYVFCKSKTEHRAQCPSDLVFDPVKGACVYKSEYTCPKPAKVTEPNPICLSVSDMVRFADALTCNKYKQCTNGQLNTFECDSDKAFDHLQGACVHKEDAVCISTSVPPAPELTVCGTAEHPKIGYFSDDQTCSGYYVCKNVTKGTDRVDREPIFAKCSNGFFFDSEKLSCRDRLNVKCKFDRCEGMGNKYVNLAGNCKLYARCKDNVSSTTGECPVNYFFDEKTQGCTPHNVNYVACNA